MVETVDSTYKFIARSLTGLLGGIVYGTAPGMIITTIIVGLWNTVLGTTDQLYVWILVGASVGGIIGAIYRLGGGLVSGLITGILVGFTEWYVVTDPSGISTVQLETMDMIDIVVFGLFAGALYGAVGGAIGGMISGMIGESPVPSRKLNPDLSRYISIIASISLFILTSAIIIFSFIYNMWSDFQLSGIDPEESMEAMPLLCLVPFLSLFVTFIFIRLLRALDDRYFMNAHIPVFTRGLFHEIQHSLISELTPLIFALIGEFLTIVLFRSVFGDVRLGVGALLGVGIGTWLQGFVTNQDDNTEPTTHNTGRKSKIRIWASITAAVFVAAIQIFLLPDF